MQNVSTYRSSPGLLAALPAQGGTLAYMRASTLSIWMFTLLVRYWWISDWFALQEQFQQGVNIRAYYYVGFAIALAAHVTVGFEALLAAPFAVFSTWSGRLFTVFCFLMFVLSPLSVTPRTAAIYSVATWAVLAMLVLYWQSDYRVVRRMVAFAGVVVMAWLYVLLFKHGLIGGFGSAIGGLNRNITATAAVGAAVCCQFSNLRSIRWGSMALALLMSVLVTSRGSMLALGVFVFVQYTLYRGVLRTLAHSAIALAVVATIFIAASPIREFVLEDVIHLHDQYRGIGSGFTGRFDFWAQAIDAFWGNPVIGVGFRATSYGGGGESGAVHSGYLKLLIETGLVGTILVLSAVFIEGIRRVRFALRYRDMPPQMAPGIDIAETMRVNVITCATIAMTLTIWVYEQLYINLGSVISLVFFLMMAAPAYITTQGVTLRR